VPQFASSFTVSVQTPLQMVRPGEHAQVQAVDEGIAWPFLLHDVCGFDLLEVAEILDAPVSEVQALLVRARREVHGRVAEDPALAAALRAEDPGIAARPFFAATAAALLRRAASTERHTRTAERARVVAAIRDALPARTRTRAHRALIALVVGAIVAGVAIVSAIPDVSFFSLSR
jgi:hypothetical protein